MSNKVGIGVEAQFDAASVERQINALGQKIAAANRVQFTPVTKTTAADLDKIIKQFEQLRKIHGDLNKRMNATGQGGANLFNLDWDKMYADPGSRARAMRKVFEYSTGAHFHSPSPPPPPPGGGGGPGGPSGPRGPTWSGMAYQVTQAGLRASGPAGGVAAGALGTGMSAGFGAGLMGLLGGMLALGVGKVVGAAVEKVGQAETNAIALDRLKRTLGDVNVSFEALKAVVHGGADNLKITYEEAGRLATQFVKLGNVSGDQYKTIADELGVGVGMAKAFGMDPSQTMGVLGQMRGLGITQSTQESRRFALLIGETIGKAGAFAKADEVMDAIANFADTQTRNNMGAANVAGYAGMFSGMVGSGIPGLDPQGAAGLLARINSSLSAGGAKGEASQFFTALVGNRLGLDPIQTQILREGGAFATNDSMFGEGSAASRYGLSGPGGGKTFLQASLEELRRQYGGNKGLLAQATANHLGIGINQAMAMLSISPNEIGEMQQYGDLGKLSGNGIGNLSKALYGSAADRQALAQSLMARGDVSADDKSRLSAVMNGGSEQAQKEMLAKLTAQYDQERTTGSDIRDSKNALDNIKTNLADKLIPIMQEVRHGIMFMAGGGKMSPTEVMSKVLELESKDRQAGIHGEYEAKRKAAIGEAEAIMAQRREALDNLKKNRGNMTPEQIAAEQQRIIGMTEEYTRKSEEVRQRIIKLHEEEAKAIEAEVAERNKRIEDLKLQNQTQNQTTPSLIGAGAGRGFVNPPTVGSAPGGGRYFKSGNGLPDDVKAMLEAEDRRVGLPVGTMASVVMQETSGNAAYLNDPSKYHYDLDASGRRIAPHTGKVSTAFGPFGLLESTAARPGYGVSPLRDKSLQEQARFSADYLAARARAAGSLQGGLSGYGEGPGYGNSVMSRLNKYTPLPGDAAGAGGNGGRFIFDAAPIEIIHKNERGDYMHSDRLATSIRPATPFGTERYG